MRKLVLEVSPCTVTLFKKVTEFIYLAENQGLICPLDEEMTDKWIEEFLYPEKTLEGSGRQPFDFDYIHDELSKA